MSPMNASALAAIGLGLLMVPAPALAQDLPGFSICQSQQELEQVIASQGSILPDGCRSATISSLESNGEQLCLLDLSSAEGGVLDQLREVAAPQQWWVRCADLMTAAR